MVNSATQTLVNREENVVRIEILNVMSVVCAFPRTHGKKMQE